MAVPRVAVVGSLNMDLVVRARRWPESGETLPADGFATIPGGKGCNQAVAARRAGAAVAMVGRVGRDAFGQVLRGELERESIDTAALRDDGAEGTGVALICVDASGQNRILVVPRANGAVSAADVEAARDVIAGARVLLLQNEIPAAASRRAAEIARAAGCLVLWSPAPAPAPGPEADALLALADWVLPNASELAALAGASGEEGARALRRRGTARVLATLGAEGALLAADAAAPVRRLAAHRVPVVDTVGAGDALTGAFAAALAAGESPERAAALGLAAGALACTRVGALPSMPRREEILRLAGQS